MVGEWRYTVLWRDPADGMPRDVHVMHGKDIMKFTKAFVREFQPKLHHYDFHDALLSLVTKGKAEFYDNDKSQVTWSVSLEEIEEEYR